MNRTQRWTLIAAVLGSGSVFLDSTVVNVALPRIGRDLPSHLFAVLEGQAYVYTGYLLTLSALLVLAGALSDRYGRRRIFAIGLAGFGLTSLLCGLAPNMELLVAGRLLQGVAGALLVPGSLALITAAFDGEAQGRAIGTWAAATSATTLLGPLLGGLLVDTVSWRAVFLLNLPLVALALWAVAAHVDESRDLEMPPGFDWQGAILTAAAVGGLSLGVIYGQQRNWQSTTAWVLLGAGLLALVVLPLQLRSSPHPLVPLELFRSRNFTITNVSTLLIYGALYVVGYYVGLLQQGTLGYTAAAAGLGLLPGSLMLVFFSRRFGALAARRGPRLFMTVGPLLMAAGVLWWARVGASSSPWRLTPADPNSWLPPLGWVIDFLPGSLIFGAGLCLLVAPLTAALMASVPKHNSGVASAVNNAISRIGPQLAGAVIFVAITATFYAVLATRVPGLDTSDPGVRTSISPLNPPPASVPASERAAARDASVDAFRIAMLVGAGLLLAGAAVNYLGIENQPGAEAVRRSRAA
ncbi:MAG TPA: MFS transporter [Candidatus Dormibacteraeota bacterium]